MSKRNIFPLTWMAVPLGNIAEFEMGQAPPGDACNHEGIGTLFVKAGEFGVNRPIEREWTTKPLKFGRRGDVFICVVGATCGKLNLGADCAIGRSVAAIRSSNVLDQHYLYYQLQPQVMALRSASAGSAQGVLNRKQLSDIEIRIAPINEQRRIVAKIEELFSDVDAGVAALNRAKANLKRYRASVLKAAVEGKLTEEWRARHPATEPASALLARILKERRQKWEADQLAKFAAANKEPPKNWREKYVEPSPPGTDDLPALPERWCWASVDQICDVGTGTTPSRTNSKYYMGGTIPWIMSGAVNLPFVDEASEFVTELALQETTLRLHPVGTLILALYGEGKTRGMVSELRIEGTVNQALGALVFADSAVLIRSFVKVFLTSNYVQLRRQAAGGMQPNLNLGIVKQIAIPLPPLDEQTQIVGEVATRVSQIDDAETTIEQDILRADRLRHSILKQAFEGRLVPQNPDDEPASVLLDRLKSNKEPSVVNDKGAKTRKPKRLQMKAGQERLPLVEIVAKHPKGISPDDAFRDAGYDQENVNDVDSFYAELDRDVKKKTIEVQRPDDATILLTPRVK
jgi:type I restriction enzyme S subunit